MRLREHNYEMPAVQPALQEIVPTAYAPEIDDAVIMQITPEVIERIERERDRHVPRDDN